MKLNRDNVHSFFELLIAGNPPEEQVALLRDILVDEFCFRDIKDKSTELDYLIGFVQEVIDRGNYTVEKIHCIRDIRQKTGWGLAEAKTFVEEIYNKQIPPTYPITSAISQSDLKKESLCKQLNAIAKTYGLPPQF